MLIRTIRPLHFPFTSNRLLSVFIGLLMLVTNQSSMANVELINNSHVNRVEVQTDIVLDVYSDIQKLRISNPTESLSLTIGEQTIDLPAAKAEQYFCRRLLANATSSLSSTILNEVVFAIHISFQYVRLVITTQVKQVIYVASNWIQVVTPEWALSLLDRQFS